MGFSDQLRAYTGNLNQHDPIFGGLIPRRQMPQEMMQQRPMQQMNPIQPRGAIGRIPDMNQMPSGNPMNLVINQSNPGADILARSADSARETYAKMNAPQVTAGQILHASGIKPNEQFPSERLAAEGLDIDKQLDREGKRVNIDAAKQRIDQGNRRLNIAEEKQKNPNIRFMPVKGGNIMGFDSKTGDTYDTGVATNTLSEAERLNIQQDNAMIKQDDAQAGSLELEDKRQTGKKEIEAAKPAPVVNPTQQRVAEDDAARELLRDPKFAWLERDKHITVDKDGIKVNRAGASDTTYLDEFDKALKVKTKERMNITRDKTSLGIAPDKINQPPKIDDVKTYPNGNKAKFDGTGWVLIPKD